MPDIDPLREALEELGLEVLTDPEVPPEEIRPMPDEDDEEAE